MKRIITQCDCESLRTLAEMGKVLVMKEHVKDGPPVYVAISASGTRIGIIGERWVYMFEDLILKNGNNDGLFPRHSQTAGEILTTGRDDQRSLEWEWE